MFFEQFWINILSNCVSVVKKRFICEKEPAFSHIPIIAVTSYAMKGDKEKIIEAGCDAYLSKPINTRELPVVVAGMLSGAKQDNS